VDIIRTTVPTSLSVTMPDLDIPTVAYNGATGTVSWSLSGADVGDLDLGEARLEYDDGSGNFIEWNLIFTPTLTSITAPGLPMDIMDLAPPVDGLSYGVDFGGADTVIGFDALFTAIQAYMGNVDLFALSATNSTAQVERQVHSLRVSIGGTGTGTVTVDSGAGPVTVMNGDVLEIDDGVTVTIAATANATFNVTALNCPGGQVTGVGTPSATCVLDSFETVTVDVQFD
jgi:hypothetical protein